MQKWNRHINTRQPQKSVPAVESITAPDDCEDWKVGVTELRREMPTKKNPLRHPIKTVLTPDMTGRSYAAIDLGTNSCRLVIAAPTPSSFRIIETFSKVTRLG